MSNDKNEIVYKNIDDVYFQLESLYDRLIEREGSSGIGQALYYHSNYIVDNIKLLCSECQLLIKEYYYSKISNTPPFRRINETPLDYIDRFMIIDEETTRISELQEK